MSVLYNFLSTDQTAFFSVKRKISQMIFMVFEKTFFTFISNIVVRSNSHCDMDKKNRIVQSVPTFDHIQDHRHYL